MRIGLALAAIGTSVLYFLGKLLLGLVGTGWDLTSCAVGAFIAGYFHAPGTGISFKKNLAPSAGVVFSTFAFISIGHVGDQIFVRRVPVDFEPVGKFVWATIATSWWLIPMVGVALCVLNRIIDQETA
jgi:hypothetical protein